MGMFDKTHVAKRSLGVLTLTTRPILLFQQGVLYAACIFLASMMLAKCSAHGRIVAKIADLRITFSRLRSAGSDI